MDEWLSQVYGTGAPSDLEKTAQNNLLQKLAEEEGIDLSGLDQEELDALAQAVQAEEAGAFEDEGQYAEGGEDYGDEGGEEELQAKFAEADFLGRVMAHAYTQELQKIASEEGEMPFPPKKKKKDEEEEEESEKTASGPIGRAIGRLGGTVEAEPSVDDVPEAVKLAFATLHAHGYIE